MTVNKPDFTGWATKSGIKCSDGRTIMGGAFKHQDKMKVPLVWSHQHNDPEMVLGYAILEHREEGVYTRAFFNDSPAGQNAKYAVDHGDVESLSIYANKLQEQNKNVLHGDIKEVSLVLSGANPGAKIDSVYLRHGDSVEALEGEAIIYTDESIHIMHSDDDDDEDYDDEDEDLVLDPQEVLESLDESQSEVIHDLLDAALTHSDEGPEETLVQAVFDSLTEEQRVVIHDMLGEALEVANNSTEGDNMSTTLKHEGKTVKDVFDSMSEEQQNVVYFMIAQAVEDNGGTAQHSDSDSDSFIAHAIQEGFANMPRNLFETHGKSAAGAPERVLSHDELSAILVDAKKPGSTLRESFLAHAVDYGIDNIDILFPDAATLSNSPDIIGRRTEWVADILGSSKHSPFSRIKSTAVDLTADEARAKGYVKGNLKKDEVIKLLKRVTTPTTIYKKQKLDRDDIIDIVDLNVVAWLKAEMRVMLDEEIARAILIGDGREPDDDDKIDEEKLRPIAWDNEMYSHPVTVPSNVSGDALIESILRARKHYKGTGTPTMYTTDDVLTDLILLKDKMNRRQYNTEVELAAALRVSKIVVVEVMETMPDLLAILVNIADYTIGADKGGEVSMFEDFDIDYNQEKYLIETRISGCLTKPKSAVVIKRTSGTTVTPTTPSFDQATNTITVPTVVGVEYYDVTDPTGTGTLLTAGATVITKTTDVEARPTAGYNFPHNTDADWTYAYTA